VSQARCRPRRSRTATNRQEPWTSSSRFQDLAGEPTEELAKRARLLLVIDEVRAGRLTRAGAARALDTALDDFLIAAGRHDLHAIAYDVEDFRRELEAIPQDRR
jgi:hypothetical protein